MNNLVGAAVNHITLGLGTVSKHTETEFIVDFSSRSLRMKYPVAFEKHLSTIDKSLEPQITKDLSNFKIKEAEETEAYYKLKVIDIEETQSEHEVSSEDTAEKPEKTRSINKKSKLTQIFEDTLNKMCFDGDSDLRKSIDVSNRKRKVFLEEDTIALPDTKYTTPATVTFTSDRSFEAAIKYKDKKVCILNSASPTTPGGRVKDGGVKQEESLCRISTLYKSIGSPNCWSDFYLPHKNTTDVYNTDDIIYSPDITVFKTDTEFPEDLPEEDWYQVNVISCSAPDITTQPINEKGIDADEKTKRTEKLRSVLERRFERIMEVAHSEGNEVLILNTFGCGSNHNPPKIVAEAVKSAIEKHGNWFETIEFALGSPLATQKQTEEFEKYLVE